MDKALYKEFLRNRNASHTAKMFQLLKKLATSILYALENLKINLVEHLPEYDSIYGLIYAVLFYTLRKRFPHKAVLNLQQLSYNSVST